MEFKIVIGPPLLLKTKQKIKETKKKHGNCFPDNVNSDPIWLQYFVITLFEYIPTIG